MDGCAVLFGDTEPHSLRQRLPVPFAGPEGVSLIIFGCGFAFFIQVNPIGTGPHSNLLECVGIRNTLVNHELELMC